MERKYSFRLPPRQEEALRFLFNDFDGICGLRSSFGAQIEALNNPRSRTDPLVQYASTVDGVQIHTFVPERWTLQYPGALRASVRQAAIAYHKIPGRQAVALYLTFGPRKRTEHWDTFKEHAPIAHLTKRVGDLADKATQKMRLEIAGRYSEWQHYRVATADVLTHEVSSRKRTGWREECARIRAAKAEEPDAIAPRLKHTVESKTVVEWLGTGSYYSQEARREHIASIKVHCEALLVNAYTSFSDAWAGQAQAVAA